MMERKEYPIGIVVFIIFIIGLDVVYLFTLVTNLLFMNWVSQTVSLIFNRFNPDVE